METDVICWLREPLLIHPLLHLPNIFSASTLCLALCWAVLVKQQGTKPAQSVPSRSSVQQGPTHSARVTTRVGRAGMGLPAGCLTWLGVQGWLQGEENLTRQHGGREREREKHGQRPSGLRGTHTFSFSFL